MYKLLFIIWSINLKLCLIYLFLFSEDEGLVFKHYAMGLSNNEVHIEGIVSLLFLIVDFISYFYYFSRLDVLNL